MSPMARLLDRKVFWQLVRYLLTGVSSAAMEVALFAYLANVLFFGINPPPLDTGVNLFPELMHYLITMGFLVAEKLNVFYANVISLTVAFWFSFLVNRKFSFRSKAPIFGQLGIYTPLFFFNLVATSIIVGYLVNDLAVLPVVAKIASIGCVVSWNFVFYKLAIFRR